MTMKQRGSALIISMMLIATIGAAAFGIAKLLYADTSIATTYENGTIAYYAAESGIEEGFLRYKYNRNAEVPYADPNNNIFWTFGDNKVFRTNLSGGSVTINAATETSNEGIPVATPIPDPTKQYYDLRMGYLGTNLTGGGPFYYHDINNNGISNYDDIFNSTYDTGDYSFLKIPKDEARTFDLSNINFASNDLAVGFKFLGVGTGVYTLEKQCEAMAEVKFTINGGMASAREYKALTVFDKEKCASLIGIDADKLDEAHPYFTNGGSTNAAGTSVLNATQPDYYYSLNDILTQTVTIKAGVTILSTDKVVMTIKPLYYPADITFLTIGCDSYKTINLKCLTTNPHSNIVTGPYTYMTSTGYYGGTTRTLTANIDRQSGTLYDLYDYVLFKGN